MAVEQTAEQQTAVTDLASYQKFALEQQAANNEWSAQQAQKQMDFQREMSNTAHQREVADLKAAGLNPVLSANSGASVPNGASGETDTSASGNVGAILQQVLQAQSAREVAGMYNAATIAAATIAANASMYGSDMSYWNTEDHPNTLEAVAARALVEAGATSGNHAPGNSGRYAGSGSGSGNPNGSAVDLANSLVNQAAKGDLFKGLLGDKDAAKRYGAAQAANQYPTNAVRNQWKSQILPRLKAAGFDTGNGKLMESYFKIWSTSPALFNKIYMAKVNANRYKGKKGKF